MTLRMPELEQRHYDLIGLGLVVAAVFFAFVMYFGWNGGQFGEATADGFIRLFGRIAYLVPVAMLAAGVLFIARPVIPAVRPFRAAGLCLLAGLTLALAAGTLGLGPGPTGSGHWDPDTVGARGGLLGEGLFWVTGTLVQTIGAHLIAIFLVIAGVLLLTGASIAGLARATGAGVAGTTRKLRQVPTGVGVPRRRRAKDARDDDDEYADLPPEHEVLEAALGPAPAGDDAPDGEDAQTADDDKTSTLTPPEPATDELVVRATHVEGPPVDGASRFPDLFGEERAPQDATDVTEVMGSEPEPEAEPDVEAPPEVDVEDNEEIPGTSAMDAAGTGGDQGEVSEEDLTPQGRYRASVTDDPDFEWKSPNPSKMLKRSSAEQSRPDTAGQQKVAAALVESLGHFGVEAKVVGMVTGPHITRYELRLAPGIKMSKVANLKDDLAYALAATDIRILAPIPGKTAVGVEVPNARRRIVQLGDVFQDPPADWSPLTVWLGKDVAGRAIGADLAKMPHLLVAGTTGAGKSGCVNAMLSSILLRASPHEVRLVLVDPKQVELNHYDSIPHLLTPVITSPRMASNALQNLVKEMESRYGEMSLARTRNLNELNRVRAKRGEPALPYILCVIDELADLMMVAPAEVEDSIIRLAQKARAVGIHLVLATQSPRVDVITGMIKANVPSRIAFAVSSQTDSRVILDQNGAESLLGQGDMLFSPVGSQKLQRIQGAYIDEDQIARVTGWWRRQGEPDFQEELLEEVESGDGGDDGNDDSLDPDEDPLLEEAIQLVVSMGTASTSMLQRRLRLGYTRAGRLVDMLERRGVISGYEGSKPRQVLITEADLPRVLSHLREASGDSSAAENRDPVGVEDPS
jgi:S-DNA-T family DNA segregation ATPase FtsK/SpoIIIE